MLPLPVQTGKRKKGKKGKFAAKKPGTQFISPHSSSLPWIFPSPAENPPWRFPSPAENPPTEEVETQGLRNCTIISGAQLMAAAMNVSTYREEVGQVEEGANYTKEEKRCCENPDEAALEELGIEAIEDLNWITEKGGHQPELGNDEDNDERVPKSSPPLGPTTTNNPLVTPQKSPTIPPPQESSKSSCFASWCESTSSRKGKEKSTPMPEIADDSFLETWDMTIHRCRHCNRPFGTQSRLLDHLSALHVPGAPEIGAHQTSEILSELNGFEDIHVIADGGDIVIQVKSPSGANYWWVASQILWTTSRVFRAMFGPNSNFQEAAKIRRSRILGFPPALVPLEDDDPTALGLVLATLHHRNDLLPDKIPFEQLINIAAIIDKYELQCVLESKLSKLWEPPRTSVRDDDWLFVSYVFGNATVFAEVSKDLILRGALDTDGALVFGEGESTHSLSEFTPESVIKRLIETREFHVEKLRKYIETTQAMRSHIRGKGPQVACAYFHIISYSPRECEVLQLGHVIQSISEYQLDDNDTWNGSLSSISDKLRKIRPMSVISNYCVHDNCSWVPELHKLVDNTLGSVEGLKLSDFPSRSRLSN